MEQKATLINNLIMAISEINPNLDTEVYTDGDITTIVVMGYLSVSEINRLLREYPESQGYRLRHDIMYQSITWLDIL